MTRSRLATWSLLALVVLAIAACSQAATPAAAPPAGDGLAAGPVAAPPADGETDSSGRPGTPNQPGASFAAFQQTDQQLIVYTGTLDLQVDDLRAAVDQADQLVAGLGGHVASSNATNNGDKEYAKVTYRIPAEKWDEALAGLHAVGVKVLNETIQSEDVTGQVVDLDARIANAQASEAALQAIMDKATTIDEVLKVQRELTSVRGDIESMTAQRNMLANRAQLATLEVDFETAVTEAAVATGGWDLASQIDNALAALVRIGQGVVTLAIWVLIVLVPVMVPVIILLLIAVWLRRRWLRTHPGSDVAGPPIESPSI